jgi:hypothetical protein
LPQAGEPVPANTFGTQLLAQALADGDVVGGADDVEHGEGLGAVGADLAR